MTQNTHPDICIWQALFENFEHFVATAESVAFGNYYEVHEFLTTFFFEQRIYQFFNIRFAFWNQDIFCPGSNTTMKSYISRIATHYFYNK